MPWRLGKSDRYAATTPRKPAWIGSTPYGSKFMSLSILFMSEDELARVAVECAFRVHRTLGPGLLESAYVHCLMHELRKRNIPFLHQHPLPVIYDGVRLDAGYRLDLWLDKKLIIEVKSVTEFHPIHTAQLLTYLKLAGNQLGLLINFNELFLKDGLRRVVNGFTGTFEGRS
jgi:GxxExxY protein